MKKSFVKKNSKNNNKKTRKLKTKKKMRGSGNYNWKPFWIPADLAKIDFNQYL